MTTDTKADEGLVSELKKQEISSPRGNMLLIALLDQRSPGAGARSFCVITASFFGEMITLHRSIFRAVFASGRMAEDALDPFLCL